MKIFFPYSPSYFLFREKSSPHLLPILFNVKLKNYFFSTLLGIVPSVFLVSSIGSGLEKVIDQNLIAPSITDIIFSPDIYVPLIAFFILILTTIFLRKFFYRN